MVQYNSKDWLKIIFQFKKADTIRQLLPLIVLVAAYTAIVAFVLKEWLKVPETSPLRQFNTLHTLIGFVISMLLVFRTNTAYDRWWEGRRLWGSLVNNSRNMANKMHAYLPHNDTKNRAFFKKIIPLFTRSLILHLRSESTRLALDTEPHPEIPDFDLSKHVPNQIASLMTSKLNRLYKEQVISGDQFIIINAELQSFMDICGACERIKNTPIPYSYSVFIKKFIFLYVATLPIGLTFTMGYLVVAVVAIVFYVLASMELIAEEIEEPFGTDMNDLPLERIADNIRKDVEHALM